MVQLGYGGKDENNYTIVKEWTVLTLNSRFLVRKRHLQSCIQNMLSARMHRQPLSEVDGRLFLKFCGS